MESDPKPKGQLIILSIIVPIVCVILGIILQKYFLKEKPELTYQIIQGDPIEIDIGKYYPTTIIINNAGDVPLTDVMTTINFSGIVSKVTTDIQDEKINDDSLNVKRVFRLPIGETNVIKVTSKGSFNDLRISSKEVVGQKYDPAMDEKQKKDTYLKYIMFILLALFLISIPINYIRAMKKGTLKPSPKGHINQILNNADREATKQIISEINHNQDKAKNNDADKGDTIKSK